MNWEAIGAKAEIIGATGVILTLAYLGLQIKSNTNTTRASIRQQRLETAVQLTSSFYNSPYLPGIGEKLSAGEELTSEEVSRFRLYVMIWHRNFEISVLQESDGLLDSIIIDGMKRVLTTQFKINGVDSNFKQCFPRFQKYPD